MSELQLVSRYILQAVTNSEIKLVKKHLNQFQIFITKIKLVQQQCSLPVRISPGISSGIPLALPVGNYVIDVLASPFFAQRLLFVQINTKDRANFSLSVLTFGASVFVILLY